MVDSGLALLLITLLAGLWLKQQFVFRIAFAEGMILLVFPAIFYPFAFLWLNLSEVLGRLMSKLILTVIFVVFVCPVALARKILGIDSLSLRKFNKNHESVFTERGTNGSLTDFTKPY